MQNNTVIVVGAGPAGMMAAIRAAQLGAQVSLLERKPALGNKLLMSGKGRCNLTNASSLDVFLKRFSSRAEFLRDAFKKFFNRELMDFFEKRGLKLKVERQLRVFPESDRAGSVLEVLEKELGKLKVNVMRNAQVEEILLEGGSAAGVRLKDKRCLFCRSLIFATGGASYPATGSDGSAFNIIRRTGHTIVTLKPGLVPLEVSQRYPKELEGLALKNISIKFSGGKNRITSEVGELIFTSYGISGPLVISLSAKISDWLREGRKVFAQIDLKPGLSVEQLDKRLLREFEANARKNVRNACKELLPLRLIDVFMRESGISPDKKCSQLTQAERRKIISLLKGWRLDIRGTRPLEEGIVTRGGVSLKEIDPRTMQSRLVKGLYFCGEMIDVDADTGGFNLQAAFSTGHLAGTAGTVLRSTSTCPTKS